LFRNAVLVLLFIDEGFGQRITFVMNCFLKVGGKQTSFVGGGAEGKYGTKK
jgi:hypothetical protein